MKHFAIFGSHPRLSSAELSLTLGKTAHIQNLGSAAIIEDASWDGGKAMNRLGGTVKVGDVILETTITELQPERLAAMIIERPRGSRIVFGLTTYGVSGMNKKLDKLGLALKRALQNEGKSARWVTSRESIGLSPAAVAKLDLTRDGYDLAILVAGRKVFVGLTTNVQDATAWSERDYGRPSRSEEAGMLPPKLARMMVNLAELPSRGVLFDPFCGSGTILMEAALATDAKKIIGSDIESAQIKATNSNLDWLMKERILSTDDVGRFKVFQSDARKLESGIDNESVDAVVTEGSLGPLLKGSESRDVLEKNANELIKLWRETLVTLRGLLRPHGRIVCIWPTFVTSRGSAHVSLSAKEISELGYSQIGSPLLYERPNQRVKRNIVVLQSRHCEP
ncbi:MAG: hypothetical protein AAB386_02505, partial [Patescibacteria group bacterium]